VSAPPRSETSRASVHFGMDPVMAGQDDAMTDHLVALFLIALLLAVLVVVGGEFLDMVATLFART